MTDRKAINIAAVLALLSAAILVGCGGETPESMLNSAKGYMAKNDNKAAMIQLKNALQKDPNLGEARYLLGKALLEGGEPATAEVELRKASDLKYSVDQVVPLLARAQLVLGQPKKVTEDLAKVQLASPESKADLLVTTGQAYLMQGKIDAAQTAFDTALKTFPDYAPALVGQARIKAANRDLPGALALLDSVLEKSPKLYDVWQLKGDFLHARGDAKGSLDAYHRALEIKPDYIQANASLVSRYIEDGSLDEAGKQLESLKKIAPKHPQTTFLQAQLLYRQKDFKAAQESIQKYLGIFPDSIPGLQLAGAIAYELKSYPMVETYLMKAISRAPELPLARRILIASYLRSDQPAKALATLQPLLDKIDKDSNMLALAGEVYMRNGDSEKAGAYFTKAAALDPTDTKKRTSVALSHLAQGETDTAYRELEQISSLETGTSADMALIASQLQKRKFDQALKSIAVLEKKQPENPSVPHLRGGALLGKGDVVAARKSFEQALAMNAAYFPAAASLASLDLADNKPDDAKKRFEGVLVKDPKNVQALMSLAELRGKTGGKLDEVADLINKAIAANPAEATPRIVLIGVYLGAKENKKALAAAQDALTALPDQPDVLDAAGRAQQAADESNQALATYGKLASLVPNSPQPHLRMAEIHLAAKNKESAMQELRKTLSIKPDSVEAQRGIMMLDMDAGRTSEALATARQIQKQRPKEAVGYVLEGDAHALKKSWNEAATVYRNGLKKSGDTVLAMKLHDVLEASGGASEAERFADGWLKEHAKDLRFRLYLAEAANARKDYQSASKHYRVLLDAQPNNPVLMNNLAWSLAQFKDPKAIEYAENAYKLAPDQPAILDTLGWLLVEKGDMARGVELLQKAVNLAPKLPMIRLNLAKALVKAGKKDEAKKELEVLAKLGENFPAKSEVEKMLQSL
ncbi:MAG: PEP-CTERM system TPR-repeat protein PrsT [Propionivibrio sp.]|uniref:XrtA/PEP-CTERM system TPR-repeat protein PrsT n=1 Tax=Propionivibrio sp. TaxID=2212460 RepID=UPI0025D45217|nr:XrtA/PEP-CTERM system TPR-repeat protein PrsT [Propionivibrio sp.]MBK8894976.1 PEP-CTERM system TPR-repeat protein PrsT [Propionivibrio sp.]